jgi:pimeloyl-ACP methyl ester carboxylesterase
VAFEYLKRCGGDNGDAAKCLSLTMSSVPTETKMVEEEAKRLLQELMVDCPDEELHATFSQTHECRAVPTPLALTDAYAQAATLWRGAKAIPNYKASGVGFGDDETTNGEAALSFIKTPCHILRGQYDFVTEPCVEGWGNLFPNSQSTVLSGCSHHALLENEQLYGDVILAFMEDYDL